MVNMRKRLILQSPKALKTIQRANQINADQNKVTIETVEVKSSAEAEVVLNNALDDIEKEMKIMCEIEIQVDINDFVENDELDGLG